MAITLDPETERRLETVARVRRTDPGAIVRSLVEGVVLPDEVSGSDIQRFDEFRAVKISQYGSEEAIPETEYLAQINRGFPEDFWDRYDYLRGLLENGEFDESLRPELLRLVDRRERANVERLKYVIALARRRGMAPQALWQQMGLGNSSAVANE